MNLTQIAVAFCREAKPESSYKRIQRFFRSFAFSEESYAKAVLQLLPSGPYFLTMDRTNWKFGKKDINILMIGIVHEGTAFPLFWKILPKKGNSNTQERKEITQKAIDLLGREKISALLADREFIGKEWFTYLQKQNISFCIRIRENFRIHGSKQRSVKDLVRGLAHGETLLFPRSMEICGTKLFVSGAFVGAEYCIVVSDRYQEDALEIYLRRWGIEVLFGCLKSRGFCFEDTHMTDFRRISKLIALLSIAFVCMHIIGEWQHALNPIALKKHGRRAKSIFRMGLDYFRNILFNVEHKFHLLLRCLEILRNFLSCT